MVRAMIQLAQASAWCRWPRASRPDRSTVPAGERLPAGAGLPVRPAGAGRGGAALAARTEGLLPVAVQRLTRKLPAVCVAWFPTPLCVRAAPCRSCRERRRGPDRRDVGPMVGFRRYESSYKTIAVADVNGDGGDDV